MDNNYNNNEPKVSITDVDKIKLSYKAIQSIENDANKAISKQQEIENILPIKKDEQPIIQNTEVKEIKYPENMDYDYSKNTSRKLKDVFHEIKVFMSKATTKELLKFTLECILLAIIVVALSIPFNLIISLGENILRMISINPTEKTLSVFNVICYSIYTIIAITYYILEFKSRFYNINDRYKKSSNN